ncbi:hypothetical protein Pla110_33790 [Polystyrenella longa]|uniref:Tetratricopeptide repeat protein n=1 Tax=Polystyrenella longa TaxID=2528007 RepID=A0A518CQX5_9PLAN|nr:hypothetical protein [Polystyrenella longa]QDU81636.1 hypothetical protein Pla110_33790 [Polystyrenella longa]
MSTQILPTLSRPIAARSAHSRRLSVRLLLLPVLFLLLTGSFLSAEDDDKLAEEERLRRSTAVALNYCRASFHRIQKYPTPQVLMEERDNILSNLNLNEIDDEEIIRLYTGVLQEINGMELADRERAIVKDKHSQAFNQKAWARSLDLAANFASANMVGMVQTGAAGWWDYRTFDWQRDLDVWKLDKERMNGIYDKSSSFLDTFWKLTRKRNIPDNWLIRSTDLDALEEAMKEKNPQVRLRVLRRMERFMEFYPPYVYYVARTEQELGQLFAANQTYGKLDKLCSGHFRQDEMLATGLANMALIQAYLKQPTAVATARAAMEKSTNVWQVNLVCARILSENREYDSAEESLLRNLDIGLEESQSRVGLLTLYYQAGDKRKMLAQLQDPKVLASVPPPVLLQCSALFDAREFPPQLRQQLANSIRIEPQLGFGADDLVIVASPEWNFETSDIVLQVGQRRWNDPYIVRRERHVELRFPGVVEWGTPLQAQATTTPVAIGLRYAGMPTFQLTMTPNQLANPNGGRGFGIGNDARNESSALLLTTVEMNQMKLPVNNPLLSWQGGNHLPTRRTETQQELFPSSNQPVLTQQREMNKPDVAATISDPQVTPEPESLPVELNPFGPKVKEIPVSLPKYEAEEEAEPIKALPTYPTSQRSERDPFSSEVQEEKPEPKKRLRKFIPRTPPFLKGIISAEASANEF